MRKTESTPPKVELKKLCGFEKGRIHATFSDHSSLIFQNNNACITYFFSNGEKIRFYLENTPTRDEIRTKVYLVLRKNNEFRESLFMNQEELYANDQKEITLNRLNHCTWPIKTISLEKTLKVKEDGAIEFTSVDNAATVRLLDNGIIFEVEYLQILKNKKPIWVNRSSLEEDSDNKLSSTMDLIQGLASKKSQKKDNPNVLKLGFEYVRVKKIFSIFNFPACWAYSLFITFRKFEEIWTKKGFSIRFQPAYPSQFLPFIEHFSNGALEDLEELNSDLSSIGILKAASDTLINELPNAEIDDNEKGSKVITYNDVWQKDNVNPLSDFYLNDSLVHHQISKEFALWLTHNGEAIIWVLADNSLVLSSNEGNYYTHFYKNLKATLNQDQGYEGYEHKFSKDTVALLTRSKKDSAKYSLQEIVFDTTKIIKKSKLTELEKTSTSTVNTSVQDTRTKDYYKTLPFDSIDQRKNEHGTFEAFKNHSIKVVFRDRTVLRINFGEEVANILTKLGDQVSVRVENPKEFEYYVNVALQYYDDVFLDPETKLAREQEAMYRNEMIRYELEKNSRLLNIVTNNLPPQGWGTFGGVGEFDKENDFRSYNQSVAATPQKIQSTFDMDELSRRIQEQMQENERILNQIKKCI